VNVTCKAIRHRDEYSLLAEAEIREYFHEVIFQPVLDQLETHGRENENDALKAAILAGVIIYGDDGIFRGAFTAATSFQLRKLGAMKTPSGFTLPSMPVAIRFAITQAKQNREEVHNRILETLALIAAGAAVASTGIQFTNTVDKMIADLQKQFIGSLPSSSGLTVPREVPPALPEMLKQQMKSSTDLAIKNFTAESTANLRAKVQQNMREGGRADRLAQIIEAEYGVSKRKAAVIAESETSLATAAFTQERFVALGSSTYRWRTMGDCKVRPTHGESNNHRVLEGRIFPWSSPPIVDPATGRRRHPGQDYGPCRCFAEPILTT
jgi:SPP1 gp7 family putative phage head morphogenesis protein